MNNNNNDVIVLESLLGIIPEVVTKGKEFDISREKGENELKTYLIFVETADI